MHVPSPDTALAYFRYGAKILQVGTSGSDPVAFELELDSGAFVPASFEKIFDILSGADVELTPLSRDEFVVATEDARRNHLHGTGPVFALYGLIDAIYAQTQRTHRALPDKARAYVTILCHNTFQLWEEELANRAAGEPASFRSGPK